MNSEWQRDLAICSPAAAVLLPPAPVRETGWDILLALHSDERRELSLEKLASLVSVHRMALGHWLTWLEDRKLVAGVRHGITGELRAELTKAGRELLDRYWSAIRALQPGTRH